MVTACPREKISNGSATASLTHTCPPAPLDQKNSTEMDWAFYLASFSFTIPGAVGHGEASEQDVTRVLSEELGVVPRKMHSVGMSCLLGWGTSGLGPHWCD